MTQIAELRIIKLEIMLMNGILTIWIENLIHAHLE